MDTIKFKIVNGKVYLNDEEFPFEIESYTTSVKDGVVKFKPLIICEMEED